MTWRALMQRVLQPANGLQPEITSAYAVTRSEGTSPHVGVDFNYPVGPTGINLTNPALRSPVAGIVTNAGQGTVGRIAIRDADGFLHEILHTHRQFVNVGDPVAAGQLIGLMGNKGARHAYIESGPNHVHYQLRDPTGRVINPTEFWDRQDSVDPNPASPAYLQEQQQYLHILGSDPSDESIPLNPGGNVRRLGRRVLDGSGATVFETGASAVPFAPPNHVFSSDQPETFDNRYGNWDSSASSPPFAPGQTAPPPTSGPIGPFSGRPMPPDFVTAAGIWNLLGKTQNPDNDQEEWYKRWRGMLGPPL